MRGLIFVNGQPRAGKDTTIGFLRQSLRRHGILSDEFSSIEPVREMLEKAGFDLSQKTEADRKLLSVIGDATEEHSAFRTSHCIFRTNLLFDRAQAEGMGAIMFLHTREPKTIEKLRMTAGDIPSATVFVKSDRAVLANNPSDAGVFDMEYDFTIENNGTLDDLQGQCAKLARHLPFFLQTKSTGA